jgi:hypothetical protein
MSFALTHLAGFGGGGAAPSISYVNDPRSDEVDRATYTFSAVNLGTTTSGKHVILAIRTVTRAVSTVTVDGVTATQAATASASSGFVYLYIAAVSATSGDIVVTISGGSAARCGVLIYEALNLQSATPVNTASDTTDPLNLDLSIPGASVAVGLGATNGTTTCAWTGLTEDFDANNPTVNMTTASATLTAAEARTITCDITTVSIFGIGCSAVWS